MNVSPKQDRGVTRVKAFHGSRNASLRHSTVNSAQNITHYNFVQDRADIRGDQAEQNLNPTNVHPEDHLPPKPQLFVGRENLVAEITSALAKSSGHRHIVLAGNGGIGKSSIAKAILHEYDIKKKFTHRYFIRYDDVKPETVTFRTFLHRIVDTLGATTHPGTDERATVFRYLRNIKNDVLLVLDNAETFLDSEHDSKRIRDFLVELGDMASVNLMLTTRTTDIPALKACVKHDIAGLELNPAREAFVSTYGPISSEIVDKLLSAVEFHPLSIVLLANAGSVNKWSPKMLEAAWNREHALIIEGNGKHEGLGITVEVSLNSPSIAKLGKAARSFLYVVALLPQGIHCEKLQRIFPAVPNIHKISDATCVHSLTYRNGSFITMLAPIRLYLLGHYRNDMVHDTCFDSAVRTYRRLLLGAAFDPQSIHVFGLNSKWIIEEDVNVEHLVALDLQTSGKTIIGVSACNSFLHLLIQHKPRLITIEPEILAIPDVMPKIYLNTHSLRNFFSQLRPVRLLDLLSPHISIPRLWATSAKIFLRGTCMTSLASLNIAVGSLKMALRLVDEAAQLFLSAKLWAPATNCLLAQTSLLVSFGQYLKAEKILQQASQLSRTFRRDPSLQALIDIAVGEYFVARGDPKGISHYQSAYKTIKKHDIKALTKVLLPELGNSTLKLLKDSSTAEGYFRTLMKLGTWYKDDMVLIAAKMGLVGVAFSKGEVEHALGMRDELIALHLTIEGAKQKIEVLSRLADWAADEGQFAAARGYIRALDIFRQESSVPSVFLIATKFSEARIELFDQSLRGFVKAKELLTQLKDSSDESFDTKCFCSRTLGEIAILENDNATAREYFLKLKAVCDENGINPDIFGGNKFPNRLTNAFTQKDIFLGWPEFLKQEKELSTEQEGSRSAR